MSNLGRYQYPREHENLNLFIFGAGETGRIAFRGFLYDSPYKFAGFVVDDKFSETHPKHLYGHSVTTISNFIPKSSFAIFVALAAKNLSQNRLERVEVFSAKNTELVSYVSSRAFVDNDVEIGKNVLVLENNTLQSEVKVDHGTLIWSGNHIGHQTHIGKYNFLSSHVCIGGRAKIGNQNYLGMNCTIMDGITIQDQIVIGSNSFVNRDISSSGVYVGTPAKLLEGRNPRESI